MQTQAERNIQLEEKLACRGGVEVDGRERRGGFFLIFFERHIFLKVIFYVQT